MIINADAGAFTPPGKVTRRLGYSRCNFQAFIYFNYSIWLKEDILPTYLYSLTVSRVGSMVIRCTVLIGTF